MAGANRVQEQKRDARHERMQQRAMERQADWENALMEKINLSRNLFTNTGGKVMKMREIRVKIVEGREYPFMAIAKGTQDGKPVVAFCVGGDPFETMAQLGANIAAGAAKVQADRYADMQTDMAKPVVVPGPTPRENGLD